MTQLHSHGYPMELNADGLDWVREAISLFYTKEAIALR